jgi:hypothetical protein
MEEEVDMAEPASRIESATSYREPDGNKPPIDPKEKPRFQVKAAGASRERAEHDDPGDSERHQLDTLA